MLQFFKWYLPITGGTTTTEYEDTWTMFALFSQSEASGFLFFGFSLDWKTLHVCCTVTFMKYTVWCAISLEGERYRLHRMGSIKTFFWAAELTVVYIWSFGIWCNHRDKKVELLHTLSTEFKFPLFWMRIKKIHFYIKTTSQPSPPTPKPSSDLLNIFWVLIKIGRYAYLFSS